MITKNSIDRSFSFYENRNGKNNNSNDKKLEVQALLSAAKNLLTKNSSTSKRYIANNYISLAEGLLKEGNIQFARNLITRVISICDSKTINIKQQDNADRCVINSIKGRIDREQIEIKSRNRVIYNNKGKSDNLDNIGTHKIDVVENENPVKDLFFKNVKV